MIMESVKTFSEFISGKRKMFTFEWGLSRIDKEINDIIWESMGHSDDVEHIVNNLVEQINECIADGEFERMGNVDGVDFINGDIARNADLYKIEQTFVIDDFVFIIECTLMDYENISDNEFQMVSTLNVVARIRKLTNTRFKLMCYVPSRNLKLCERGISILNHEIMHAWQDHNKNVNNKRENTYPIWNSLYKKSTEKLLHKPDDLLSKVIYYADLRELCAFTQQAYYELEKINDIDDVHKRIRNMEIYKGYVSIKDGIDYLKNNPYPDEYKEINKSKLMHILNLRYEKYKRNIARLIVSRKEVLEEDLIYTDVSKTELMMIWG